MIKRIAAFDPGGTTGWAYVDIDVETQETTFHCGMLQAKEHHKELFDFLGHLDVQDFTVVSESFEYRNASRAGLVLSSVEYIGVIKHFCQERKVPVVFQMAAQGKIRDKPNAFVKPDNLKRLGLYHPSQVHAMDAYGHLLYYIIHTLSHRESGYDELRLKLLARGWQV